MAASPIEFGSPIEPCDDGKSQYARAMAYSIFKQSLKRIERMQAELDRQAKDIRTAVDYLSIADGSR